MAGHSKWKQIKHRKESSDRKRGQLFSILAKRIAIAAQKGADPNINYSLKTAIIQARAHNMPQENIQRAIKSAVATQSASYQQLTLEAVGPENSGFIIQMLTENKNRALAQVRQIADQYGIKIVPKGSMEWQFILRGKIVLLGNTATTPEDIQLKAIACGALDVGSDLEGIIILTQPQELETVQNCLLKDKLSAQHAELIFLPVSPVVIDDSALRERLKEFVQIMQNQPGVERIYHNLS